MASMNFIELQQSASDCLAQNKYAEAISLYQQCIETDSTVIDNYWYYGLALFLEDQELEAQMVWQSVMVQGSSEEINTWIDELVEILETEALRLRNIDNLLQAERLYWQILQLNKKHTASYQNLATVLIEQGKIDDAVALWENSVEIKAECPEVEFNLRSLQKSAKEKHGENPDIFSPVYLPNVFYVDNLEDAKKIILTPEQGTSTEERWEKETPYLVDQLGKELQPNSDDLILDYGCGVGRLAKELIARYGCVVLGVDISKDMMKLASDYVGSERFTTCSPVAFERMVSNGLRVNHVYSIWVIQHCLDPNAEINRIKDGLKTGGRFYIVNSHYRCVPTNHGWANDGINVADILRSKFQEVTYSLIPKSVTIPELAENCFCMTLEKSD